VKICPKFEDEKLSEKFLAKMELCKIDPRKKSAIGTMVKNFRVGVY
jgi:hypothetical protein